MHRLRVLAAVLPLAVVGACAPGAVGAPLPGWGDPSVILDRPGSALSSLAVAPDGRAVAAWMSTDEPGFPTTVAERPPHGAWGAAVVAGGKSTVVPALAVTADATTVGWASDQGVGSATASAGGPFAAPWLADPGFEPPVLASSPDGWTLAAWTKRGDDRRIAGYLVSARPPGGAFETPAFFLGATSSTDLSLAIGVGGRAAMTWTTYDSGYPVYLVTRESGTASWAPREVVASGWGSSVAMDGHGDLVVVSLQGGEVGVRDRHDGTWSDPQVLGSSTGPRPQLVVNAAGDAVVTWSDAGILRVARRTAGRPFGAAVTPAGSCQLYDRTIPPVIDAAGNVLVAYPARDPRTVGDAAAVVLDTGGALHPLGTFPSSGGFTVRTSGVGIDGQGLVTALLQTSGNGRSTLSSVTTAAPVAELAATLPTAAPVDCVLPPGSRPLALAPLPAAAAPALRLLTTHPLKLRSGALRVPVRCPTSGRSCAGTLTVRAGGRQVGSAPFTLRAGSIRTLPVPVKSAKRPRSVQLRAVTAVTGGPSTTSRATLSVRR